MRRYQQVLAVFVALLFFSGLDLYLFLAEYTAITPKNWVTLAGVLVAPVAILQFHRQDTALPRLGRVALWSLAYMAISVMWYALTPSDAAVQELRDRLLAVSFLCLSGLALLVPESRRAAAIAAIAVVLATIVINGIQMIQPDWFVMQVSTRSSGLFGNANQCGAALVIGMVMGSAVVPRRLRLGFCLLVGAGVAVTFSRSGMVGWLMASVILLVVDSARTRARELVVAALLALAVGYGLIQGATALDLVDGVSLDANLADRVSFFRTFEASDDAAQERRDVAAKAWDMFLDRPLAGNGLASTVQWTERSSTHNMFLYLMADHGLLGALILPAIVFCVFLGRPGQGAGPHWAFCAFTLWYAFFSHNLFTERYQLFAFSFFAMGGLEAAAAQRSAEAAAPDDERIAAAETFPAIVRVQ
jgi:O-antigen ligase/polysaccharide polymerase Wzy-like membrane protein